MAKVKEYIEYISRGISPAYDNEGITVLNQKCIRNQTILFENARITNNIKKNVSREKYIKNYDVLINSTGVGTLGRVAQAKNIDTDITVDSHVTIARPNLDKVNGDFFGYCFKAQENMIESLGVGATGQTELSRDSILENVEIPDYTFSQQEKISNIMLHYDDLVENNNKRIKILEEMAQKIYKEWFVDFKFPNHETATFKQTELGKIPTDWEVYKLSDFGETITGKTPSKNDDSNYGQEIPFIKTPDMHYGIFCIDTIEHLSLKGANTQKNKFIPIDSICVSCIGTVGIVAITTRNSQTNQQINSIIPKNSFYREYLYFVCNNLKPTLENLGANGATMTNVNKNKFDNIQVAKPNDKLLQGFSQSLKPIFEQIKNLSLKNQTLKQTRDILLPRLISGEIDVENLNIL